MSVFGNEFAQKVAGGLANAGAQKLIYRDGKPDWVQIADAFDPIYSV